MNNMNKLFTSVIAISFVILIGSCSKYEVTPSENTEFKNLDFNYSDNKLNEAVNDDVAALGRVLFYDEILSRNGNVSCASCHKQEFSFGDNVDKSVGFLDGLTDNNTPTLINSKFNDSFFWTSRTNDFREAVSMPIFDHKEMGMNVDELLKRVENAEYYKPLLADAYGNHDVSILKLKDALAEFVGSMISVNSRVDQFLAGDMDALNHDEVEGMRLFDQSCNSCHTVISNGFDPNDIQNNFSDEDPYLGTGRGTQNLVDIGLPSEGAFLNAVRIPSLRNIQSTGPYMHDGRFESLMDVVEHYDDGVELTPMLDFRLRDQNTGLAQKLELKEKEKDQLVAFLKTLSDDEIKEDEKFSDPFIR